MGRARGVGPPDSLAGSVTARARSFGGKPVGEDVAGSEGGVGN